MNKKPYSPGRFRAFTPKKSLGQHFLKQIVARNVDRYITVSQAVGLQLQRTFHVPARKIRVIKNGIPFDRFDCPADAALRAELSQGSERPLVLTVARLDRQKGHTYLLEAACLVQEAIFLLAGCGPEKDALIAQARKLGIQERVIFLGNRADIPQLLASCDLFVLPSVYEGLPLSVLEAMAAGKAVVATAVGGTPEVIKDGETGVLVQPEILETMTSAIAWRRLGFVH